jgi:hypothetical protein
MKKYLTPILGKQEAITGMWIERKMADKLAGDILSRRYVTRGISRINVKEEGMSDNRRTYYWNKGRKNSNE